MSNYDILLDTSGEACPMPLLKTKMKLNTMEAGQVLKVIATDAGSVRDFKAFIDLTAHELTESFVTPGDGGDSGLETFVYYIVKR